MRISKTLPDLITRLHSKDTSKLELVQREAFTKILRECRAGGGTRHALSVSCGDGLWDYLAFNANANIGSIVATDIVPCVLTKDCVRLLREYGTWEFRQVSPDVAFPFEDSTFDLSFSQDVIEHTTKPQLFIQEQYRVLKKDGVIIVGTPNLLRPMNLLKLVTGKLRFPVCIGTNKEIGDYIHVQEFHERQLTLALEEAGFVNVSVHNLYLGINPINVCLQEYPAKNWGRTICHFLMAYGSKL